jgi:hypothetical protein
MLFTFDTAATLGSTTVVTQGVTGLDFTDAGTGTCKVGTAYGAGATCTVNVNFAPKFPGTRYGAADLLDSSGSVLATGYLQGAGLGPQVNVLPGTQSILATDAPPYEFFAGVAVDGGGNVYIGDFGDGWVLKETLSGGVYTRSTAVSGLDGPVAIAVDGSGNLYAWDVDSNQVVKETLTAGGGYTLSVVAKITSQDESQGVAVDGSGNLYITDTFGNQVLKETPSAGGYTQSVVANATNNGLDAPAAVATDGSGNVYIADEGNWRVLKETPSAGGYTQSVVTDNATGGLNYPVGLAVDGNGNVYIGDDNDTIGMTRVLKETPSAGGYTQSVLPINGIVGFAGIAVDGGGNVYIADSGQYRILKEDYADPPTLAFAVATVGTTSNDSPKTETVANEGNAALTFPLPGTGDNPSVPANFVWDPSSTCMQTTASSPAAFQLAVGASCTMVFDFKPTTTGSFSEFAELTDNNLNVTGAMQGIKLTGTGVLTSQAITFPQPPSPVYYGAVPITLSATGGASGNPVIFSILSGPGSLSGTNNSVLSITGWGTIVIAANQAGNKVYPAAPQVTRSITALYSQPAALTSPTPGSSLTGTSATFTWSPGIGATEYMLYLGSTSVRSNNLYNSGPTKVTSVTVTGLPTNGETIYARLYSLIGGAWHTLDYTYSEAALQSAMVYPLAGSTLTGSSETFSWSAVAGAVKYELYLGSEGAGSDDLYHSGFSTHRSATATGLPVNGEKIYARIYWYANGTLQYTDCTYTAVTAQ